MSNPANRQTVIHTGEKNIVSLALAEVTTELTIVGTAVTTNKHTDYSRDATVAAVPLWCYL